MYVAVVLDPRKKMRFLKFSFSEIYRDEVADEMVDLVRKTMDRLYDDYSRIDSPNVVVQSESKRTHMEVIQLVVVIYIQWLIHDMRVF